MHLLNDMKTILKTAKIYKYSMFIFVKSFCQAMMQMHIKVNDLKPTKEV